MTKLEYFDVEFDRDNAIYKPGETVAGKVVFGLSGPKNIRELRLKAKGQAYVYWKERNYTNKYVRYNEYRSEENYFTVIEKLDYSEDEEEITLPAGEHSYDFSFQLPHNLPCSFTGEYGYVQYTVKAILDRPWRFDHKVISAFTVIAPYESSMKQDYEEGILDDFGHCFTSFFCFDAGFINIDVSIPKSGFYPGETIELTINYDSEFTRVKITELELKLTKITTFCANYKGKSVSHVLEAVSEDGPFCKKDKRVMSLDVPSGLTPSNLEDCSIIVVYYELVLIIHVSGWHSKMTYPYAVQIWDIDELDN